MSLIFSLAFDKPLFPILVDLLDSVCLPSMATRTRTLYPQASSASNGIHNLFCYFVWSTTGLGYMDEPQFNDQSKSLIHLWIWIPWLHPDLQFCSFESFFGRWDWVLGLLLTENFIESVVIFDIFSLNYLIMEKNRSFMIYLVHIKWK